MALSKTQQAVLDTMRAIHAEGLPLIEKQNATAIGGLTDIEKAECIGVCPDGRYVGNCHVKTWGRVDGASHRTYQALQSAGYLRRVGPVYVLA